MKQGDISVMSESKKWSLETVVRSVRIQFKMPQECWRSLMVKLYLLQWFNVPSIRQMLIMVIVFTLAPATMAITTSYSVHMCLDA